SSEQRADAARSGRLTEHRDAVGVAAECGDAFAYPFEGRDLIEDAGVARTGERAVEEIGEVEEPERTEAIVDRDDHEVAVDRELRAVVPGCVAGAPDERTAVDPNHHRAARVVASRGPDVEVETVFAV